MQRVHVVQEQHHGRGHRGERGSEPGDDQAGHRAHRGSKRIKHPSVDRLDRIERFRDIGEQDLRIVVPVIDRHPRKRLAVALGPLRQQRRLPVSRRCDHRNDRTRLAAPQPFDQRQTMDSSGPHHADGGSFDARRSNTGPPARCDRPGRSRTSLSLMLRRCPRPMVAVRQCWLTQCWLTQCWLTQCWLTQRRVVQSRVACEEPARDEPEADRVHRHHRPILRADHVIGAERVPEHHVGIDQRTVGLDVTGQPAAADRLVRVVAGGEHLVAVVRGHPQLAGDEAGPPGRRGAGMKVPSPAFENASGIMRTAVIVGEISAMDWASTAGNPSADVRRGLFKSPQFDRGSRVIRNRHQIDTIRFGAPAGQRLLHSIEGMYHQTFHERRSRCATIVCQVSRSEQLDELVQRSKISLKEPWHKGIGRPKDLSLREAVVVTCGYMRQNIIQEVWAEIFDSRSR